MPNVNFLGNIVRIPIRMWNQPFLFQLCKGASLAAWTAAVRQLAGCPYYKQRCGEGRRWGEDGLHAVPMEDESECCTDTYLRPHTRNTYDCCTATSVASLTLWERLDRISDLR